MGGRVGGREGDHKKEGRKEKEAEEVISQICLTYRKGGSAFLRELWVLEDLDVLCPDPVALLFY